MRKCQENVPSKDLVQGRGQNRKGKLRQTYRLIVISIVVQANGATSTRGLQRRPAPISPTITAASCTTDPTSSGEAAERTTSIKDVCGDSMIMDWKIGKGDKTGRNGSAVGEFNALNH